MGKPIYLDYASTTPVDERVASKMMEFMTVDSNFGNPASRSHSFGWQADEAVELARSHVANLVNCDPREIVWTSGATEADNLAIKGIANFYKSKRRQKYLVPWRKITCALQYLGKKEWSICISRNNQICSGGYKRQKGNKKILF